MQLAKRIRIENLDDVINYLKKHKRTVCDEGKADWGNWRSWKLLGIEVFEGWEYKRPGGLIRWYTVKVGRKGKQAVKNPYWCECAHQVLIQACKRLKIPQLVCFGLN